jgi:hypothetical protein
MSRLYGNSQNPGISFISDKSPLSSGRVKSRTHLREHSSGKKSNHSASKINKSRVNQLMASPYSPESVLNERNPGNIGQYEAPGISDTQSKLYKEFDKCGRTDIAF